MNLQLRELRRARGLKQSELAVMLHTTDRVVGSWERGESALPLEDACALADIFNCTLDRLAGRTAAAGELLLERDERELIERYENMNDHGQQVVLEVVRSFEGGARNRLRKSGGGPLAPSSAVGE